MWSENILALKLLLLYLTQMQLTLASRLQYSVCFTVSRPSAPVPLGVTEVGAASCTVSYLPPQWDGYTPVTGYILERRTPGPDSEWIRVNDTPVTDLHYTIDNLTPDTEYEFHVAAVNKRWMSDFSVESLTAVTKL